MFEIVQYPKGPRAVRDGKVAVLYSPKFGAGWSTWIDSYPNCLYDPVLVEMIERKATFKEMCDYVDTITNSYSGGLRDIKVGWLPIGTIFEITEYDGAESIRILNNDTWEVA